MGLLVSVLEMQGNVWGRGQEAAFEGAAKGEVAVKLDWEE